jgi:hypothetical protein
VGVPRRQGLNVMAALRRVGRVVVNNRQLMVVRVTPGYVCVAWSSPLGSGCWLRGPQRALFRCEEWVGW